jgi:hypothetical protein
MAAAAQAVVDAWAQDDDGFDEDFGAGGICDEVSSALASVIASCLDGAEISEGGHDGDDHAWLIVADAGEAAGVDIPPGVYETGGGYNWRKIKDAVIRPEDVAIWKLDRRDVVAAARTCVHTGRFVFQGRTYDIKVWSDGTAVVLYQKSGKCVFKWDPLTDGLGQKWALYGGGKAIFDAAVKYLKPMLPGFPFAQVAEVPKQAAGENEMRLRPGPGFRLQADGTWAVEAVPAAVTRDARFSGFLAIEGYWCAVFELEGEEWAQKAAGQVPPDSPMARMSAVACRVAGLQRNK